jgi:hypothetical protein
MSGRAFRGPPRIQYRDRQLAELITARRAGANRFCGRSGECEKAARCIVLSACLAREVGIPGTGHYIHEEQPSRLPAPWCSSSAERAAVDRAGDSAAQSHHLTTFERPTLTR